MDKKLERGGRVTFNTYGVWARSLVQKLWADPLHRTSVIFEGAETHGVAGQN